MLNQVVTSSYVLIIVNENTDFKLIIERGRLIADAFNSGLMALMMLPKEKKREHNPYKDLFIEANHANGEAAVIYTDDSSEFISRMANIFDFKCIING